MPLWDEAEDLTGVELISEPARVNQYNRWRDAAMHYAVPYPEFVARMAAGE
ncbi:DUF6879 family protein [Streptomyces sp. NBC_01283]|uniref:DUF6879 family protein n=1 Tax=Streptomyces sp. NBC_01283 TaxID=2903812 RepID=UPI00352E710F